MCVAAPHTWGAEHFDAVIVGAGFAGIGAATKLTRLGFDDFGILNRGDELGGTWEVNDIPGLEVEIGAAIAISTLVVPASAASPTAAGASGASSSWQAGRRFCGKP